MCIIRKHGPADQDDDLERPAGLDATSKTFHKALRQRVVSGARGRGARVLAAGHARGWTEKGSTGHTDRSISIRVTESMVATDHHADTQ